MDYDNTAPTPRNLAAPHSNTAPTAITVAGVTPEGAEPEEHALTASTPSNDAPASRNLAAPHSNTAPVAITVAGVEPSNVAPVDAAVGTYTPTNNAAVPRTAAPISTINMPASFSPAFVELDGGGNCLTSLMATAADIGKIIQGTVDGELKSYQVRAGTDEQDLPGIVRPANYDEETNAVVFVQL